jgi:hypothetical protein
MNKHDDAELTEVWQSDTNWLNGKIDESFKTAQNHAYALGLKRGMNASMTDGQILELAEPFGEFRYGDAQGHKRIAFARALLAAAVQKEA